MLVAVPPALVMVVPLAVNWLAKVNPAGANHTMLVASPELTIVAEAPPILDTLAANTVSWLDGAVLSMVRVAVDCGDTLPAASNTYILYAPAVEGAVMLVAVPPALVMVVPLAVNWLAKVKPAGANHTVLVASPELTIVVEAPPILDTLAANTASWLEGAVLSTVSTAVDSPDTLPA